MDAKRGYVSEDDRNFSQEGAMMELEPKQIRISPISKTWILDLDGTIVVHDGPYIMGKDEFLPGG